VIVTLDSVRNAPVVVQPLSATPAPDTSLTDEEQESIERLMDEHSMELDRQVNEEANALWEAIGSKSDTAPAVTPKDPKRHYQTALDLTVTRQFGEVEKPVVSLMGPKVIDRGTLPGGRIPKNAVYVGRGGDEKHPWLCPFRLRKGTPEERQQIERQCRSYIEERLKKEPRWLVPLRGMNLIVYGDQGWGKLLLDYAND
jgi:hypothetical protein